MKSLLTVAIFAAGILASFETTAQEDVIKNSTEYFGPNALPVPDMLDGTTSPRVRAEIDYDYFKGFYGDHTHTISAKVNIPLFSPRANLSLWLPMEFYHNTPRSLTHQNPAEQRIDGDALGNVYVSIDMHALRQTHYLPDWTVRACLVTASGDRDEYSRFYDSPAYFFDTSIAKSIFFKHHFFQELRFVGTTGFMCWQIARYRQDDAYMYGAMAKLRTRAFTTAFSWQGYSGRKHFGDKPMTIKAEVSVPIKKFTPLIAYSYGLRNYPFHQFRASVAYTF